MPNSLILYEPPVFAELPARLALLARLETDFTETKNGHSALTQQIHDFEKRYGPAVGARYNELESLREKCRLGWQYLELAREGRLIENDGDREEKYAPSPSFRPDTELRRLFREIARRIHPDLASDEEERERRHEFMAEATLAYRAGDGRRLEWLIEHWEANANPVKGWAFESVLLRANRRIAWLRYRIGELRYETGELSASPVADLMIRAAEARTQGRNLILELRESVQAELAESRGELEKLMAAIDDIDPSSAGIIKEKAGLDR